ncbi:MAG TPA: hypothetical protein VF398_10995, partial [bacterium]
MKYSLIYIMFLTAACAAQDIPQFSPDGLEGVKAFRVQVEEITDTTLVEDGLTPDRIRRFLEFNLRGNGVPVADSAGVPAQATLKAAVQIQINGEERVFVAALAVEQPVLYVRNKSLLGTARSWHELALGQSHESQSEKLIEQAFAQLLDS